MSTTILSQEKVGSTTVAGTTFKINFYILQITTSINLHTGTHANAIVATTVHINLRNGDHSNSATRIYAITSNKIYTNDRKSTI